MGTSRRLRLMPCQWARGPYTCTATNAQPRPAGAQPPTGTPQVRRRRPVRPSCETCRSDARGGEGQLAPAGGNTPGWVRFSPASFWAATTPVQPRLSMPLRGASTGGGMHQAETRRHAVSGGLPTAWRLRRPPTMHEQDDTTSVHVEDDSCHGPEWDQGEHPMCSATADSKNRCERDEGQQHRSRAKREQQERPVPVRTVLNDVHGTVHQCCRPGG